MGADPLRSAAQHLALGGGIAWTNERYSDSAIPTEDSAEVVSRHGFMTEKLKFADLVTRLTYYPSLTIDDRDPINYKFDLDFNLPGYWHPGSASSRTSTACRQQGLSRNDYGWSNSFGLNF